MTPAVSRSTPALFLVFGLACALAVAGEDAAPKDAPADAADKPTLPNLIPAFQVSTRMYEKPGDFFKRARGGAEMKKFYTNRRNSRELINPRRKPDDAVGYSLEKEKDRPQALVYRPEKFDADNGKGWGLIVLLLPKAITDQPEDLVPELKELFERQKLVYIQPLIDRDDDLFAMAAILDIVASLREEFPPLAAKTVVKRSFIGGLGDGARVAHITALNFPNVFTGVLGIQGMAMPPTRERDNQHRMEGKNIIFIDSVSNDTPYIEVKDLRRYRKDLRLVIYSRISGRLSKLKHCLAARELAVGGLWYHREGFKVRFFDGEGALFPDAEQLEDGLRFLDGKNVPQPPMPTVEAHNMIWK